MEILKKGVLFMKRLLAFLLAGLMLLSLTACGKEEEKDSGKEEGGFKIPGGMKQTQPTEPEVEPEGTKISTHMWELVYDEEVWKYEEDDLSDGESWSEIILFIPDGEEQRVTVEIRASETDHESFRDYLDDFGFDQKAYVMENAYDRRQLGGMECLTYDGEGWNGVTRYYFGRVENASVTLYIEINGQVEDPQVEALLAGLKVNLNDRGNQDAPWYWEGTPFASEGGSGTVGDKTLTAKWIPVSECLITKETFDHFVAADGETVYLLTDGAVKKYSFDGEKLLYVEDFITDDNLDGIQVTEGGTFWSSGFMADLTQWEDEQPKTQFEDLDHVTMHPGGEWGISWFSGSECAKTHIADGSTTEITFAEVSTISQLEIDREYIYVCGYAADDSGHKVFVYDLEGKLQMTLWDEKGEGLGSITFVTKVGDCVVGLDGNMRELVLWSEDGEHLGTVEDGALFGTFYPWLCDAVQLDDGSILVVLTEDRADESAMELVAFVITGF